MGFQTPEDICAQLAEIMAVALPNCQVYSHSEIPENHTTVPALEIYPEAGEEERATFGELGHGLREAEYTIHLDLYGAVRSNLPHDLAITTPYISLIRNALKASACIHGLVQDMSWSWSRRTWRRGNDNFAGLRFVLVVTVF